jgi:hypothetical protein
MNVFRKAVTACVVAGAGLVLAAVSAGSALAAPIHPGPTGPAGIGAGRGWAVRAHAFGRSTAAPINSHTFAGYQTNVTTGSATSSAATFTVPKLSCTTAARTIAPDVGVAENNFNSFSQAGVATGCASGKAVYFPFLIANNAEANYTALHFAAGNVINLSASVTTTGITVQVTDVTTGVSVTNTITGAGASANAAWIGDDGWYNSSGTLLGVPNFGTLTFTNCLIDGNTLQRWNPQQYQRVNSTGVVQIATGALSTAGNAFTTTYKHA